MTTPPPGGRFAARILSCKTRMAALVFGHRRRCTMKRVCGAVVRVSGSLGQGGSLAPRLGADFLWPCPRSPEVFGWTEAIVVEAGRSRDRRRLSSHRRRPSRAIECALAVRDHAQEAGREVRTGRHAGEVEARGDDIGGSAVHIGTRVAAAARASEVLVS